MKQNLKSIVKSNQALYTLAQHWLAVKNRLARPIRGNNNRIVNKGVFVGVKIDIVGHNNRVEVGPGTCLSNMMIYIRGDNHRLQIGANSKYKGGSVWFEDSDCQISIGDNTTIESAHLAVTEPHKRITIGNGCLFSAGIDVRTGDSHSILSTETGQRINYAQNVTIEDHVWVGFNAVILKGVTIGHNSIISTNALVTRSIPSHSIAAGVPAKVIKSNIDWLQERIYDTE
ncbi:acyltransferase [Spirosoma agri]|uniref:Acyltransferase n=1 Tax=Spirosoma agri TaxID=1987381 RepID=A0A6M0INL6_9BACT|nr:acyltransferase [Spirosoma agri]NEU69906.1 acyltransferase [Spirosoma agri]